MQPHAIIKEYEPSPGLGIECPTEGIVYLMPQTHGFEGNPAFFGSDMLLVKTAIAEGLSIEYALPEDEREFVEHFSVALDVISLVVSVAGLIPPTIAGIKSLIRIAARRKGYKPEEIATAEVHLKIELIQTPNMIAKGLEISGTAAGVEAALDSLNSEK